MAATPFPPVLSTTSVRYSFSGNRRFVSSPGRRGPKSICHFRLPYRLLGVKNVANEQQIKDPVYEEDCHDDSSSSVYDASTIASNILYHAKLTPSFPDGHLQLPEVYFATAESVRDELIRNWNATNSYYEKLNIKQAYYLSMEFLQGRALLNAIGNLELTGQYAEALRKLGHKLENVAKQEPDAALGNGGLGRLASCFLDSLATLNYPAWGYGLRYKYGLFQQTITKDGQEEVAESWLEMGNPWEIIRHDVSYPVKFYGKVVLGSDGRKHWIGGENVKAVAYDVPIPGFRTETTLNLRLWSTKVPAKDFDLAAFNAGKHNQANEAHANAEKICYVLYPSDESVEGKVLRLKQQYTLCSASLQDIITCFERRSGNFVNWEEFPSKVAVQMNDTHPSLCIPELMRILIDIKGLSWKEAWNITQSTVAYTNHTVLPEALEKWSLELLQKLLPRHVEIIEEIDHELINSIISEFGTQDLSMLEQGLKDMRILDNVDFPDSVVELFSKAKMIYEVKSKGKLLDKSLELDTDATSENVGTKEVVEDKSLELYTDAASENVATKEVVEDKSLELDTGVVSANVGIKEVVEDKSLELDTGVASENVGAKEVVEDKSFELDSDAASENVGTKEVVEEVSKVDKSENDQLEEEDDDSTSAELSWLKSSPEFPKVVRMANLCVVGGHAVNGVAEIHSEIVKRDVFNSFYRMWPDKFQNKTNGVTPRRWIRFCNPELSKIITKWIGTEDWVVNTGKLEELKKYADNEDLHMEWRAAKTSNKMTVVSLIREKTGYIISPDAMFDIQVKRIHEYKRQLLNILGIIYRYKKMKEMSVQERISSCVPRVCIFGGKAFTTYVQAKRIVKFITDVGATINHDPDIGDLLKVIFVPDYNVSIAETLIPACDLSQHISTAGMEASGTSNMKFAMNGCIQIGTLDGANVEIRQEVGEENFFLFGAQAHEIADLRKERAAGKFVADPRFEEVLKYVRSGIFGPYKYDEMLGSLEGNEGYGRADYFLVGNDFPDYIQCQDKVDKAYRDQKRWIRMSILNTACSYKFSSDRTIHEYAKHIWNIQPIFP